MESEEETKRKRFEETIAKAFFEATKGKARFLGYRISETSCIVFFDYAKDGSVLPENPMMGIYDVAIDESKQDSHFPANGKEKDGYEVAKAMFKGFDASSLPRKTIFVRFYDKDGRFSVSIL
jgi:hypothetical protein